MSAVKQLLDTQLAPIGPWDRDQRGCVVLTVGRDVVVNIAEDESSEVVHIFSAAGYFLGADPFAVELSSDAAGEGRFSVYVAQRSGLILMLRTLERSQLDELTFRRELACHVTAARTLAPVLSESPFESDSSPADEPVRWLACPLDTAEPEALTLTIPGLALRH